MNAKKEHAIYIIAALKIAKHDEEFRTGLKIELGRFGMQMLVGGIKDLEREYDIPEDNWDDLVNLS